MVYTEAPPDVNLTISSRTYCNRTIDGTFPFDTTLAMTFPRTLLDGWLSSSDDDKLNGGIYKLGGGTLGGGNFGRGGGRLQNDSLIVDVTVFIFVDRVIFINS